MPSIRPISDLRNNANEISDFCRQTREPVYITRNGTGDMVVVSIEEYERQQAIIDLYGKLAVAEQEISSSPPTPSLLLLQLLLLGSFLHLRLHSGTYAASVFLTACFQVEDAV